MTDLATNVLYYGDNLDILRRYLPDAAVDLVYLDPPFNSNRDDNVIFRDESGNATDAQLLAFEDTWQGLVIHWRLAPYLLPPAKPRGGPMTELATNLTAAARCCCCCCCCCPDDSGWGVTSDGD